MNGQDGWSWRSEVAFLRRVLIVLAVVALALLVWQVRDALLLAFGGVVVAVVLLSLARPLRARLGLSHAWALVTVGVGLGLLAALAGLLIGAPVQAQVAGLVQRLPEALQTLETRFGLRLPPPEQAAQQLDLAALGDALGPLASLGALALNAASALVVAVVGGFFLAADPAQYRRGVAKLLPPSQHERAEEAMLASGEALRLWLIAQVVAMALVGLLAGLGTWLLGLPSPLALGLFAGLANFVPFVGAVAGAVPAVLLALAQGGSTALWTALLFIAIQQLESNMITPLIERRMVSLPPALLLFAVVAVGLLFGLPGVILAAPLTVVAFVLVKKLYVRETLGQPTEIPGEDAVVSPSGPADRG
jgi:predicted PurR-regulated permease PerM